MNTQQFEKGALLPLYRITFDEVFNALFGPGTTLEDNSGFEQKICKGTNENPKKLPSEAHAVESSCCWAREETAAATFTLALSSGNNIPLGNPHGRRASDFNSVTLAHIKNHKKRPLTMLLKVGVGGGGQNL